MPADNGYYLFWVIITIGGEAMKNGRYHAPFSLYQKQTEKGKVWYARFWNDAAGKYTVFRSTRVFVHGKKGRRWRAEESARAILREISFNVSDKSFVRYLADFWTADSIYARECAAVNKKPLSAYYIKMNHDIVRIHLEPYPGFTDTSLSELTTAGIRDWMLWAAERGVSGVRINKALQTMRVAVHYALVRGEINRDPFVRITPAAEEHKEKGVLTREEASKLAAYTAGHADDHLAALLGLLCGMRLGEVRGLQWRDVHAETIDVQHNWQDLEGVKDPKCGSRRTVPLTSAVKNALGRVKPGNKKPEDFVLPSETPGRPRCCGYFRLALIRQLKGIGITEKEKTGRNISFHSLRHSYVTLGRMAGISDMEIQALAGHRGAGMMHRYSHAAQVMNFDDAREKLHKGISGGKKTQKNRKILEKNA
jgi:integrase